MAAQPEETPSYAVERFEPGDGGPIMAYEHLHRYAACADIVRGRRVLDVASGEGYGAALLSYTAEHVVGVDVDADVVQSAGKKYGGAALEFLEADMFELPFEDGSFEIVTCFEAIEHVSSPGIALDEIARVVASDGIVIISTPDKAVYSDAAHYENEYHLHEFYRDEFYDELSKRFASVHMMGQRIRAGSELVSLDPSDSSQPALVSYLPNVGDASAEDAGAPPYLIAICRHDPSRAGRADLPVGVSLDGADRLIDEYLAAVRLSVAAAAYEGGPAALVGQLAAREAELTELNLEMVGARAYATEISRQYEASISREKALRDELLRVTRESEERGVYLLALEEHLASLKLDGDRSV